MLLVAGLLQSCGLQGECEGRIIVENPLPDITIQLEYGEHTIDLTSPPVFNHTAGKSMSYSPIVIEGIDFLRAARKIDPETGRATLLVLTPREKGTAKVVVNAQDDCLEDVRDEFTVVVE